MKTLLPILLMYSFAFTAQGRIGVVMLSYQEAFDQADLVTIAVPVSTNDTSERMILPNIAPDVSVIGIETEFVVQTILKGDKATEKFVLHHYRLAGKERYSRGPGLVSFDPTNRKSVLLFLKKEPDGRYAPINGQTDPDMAGILPADRIDLIAIAKPLSEKRYVDTKTFSELYHGRADVSPPQNLTGYQTKFGVQELLKGDKATKTFVLHHYERPVPHSSIDFNPQPDQLYLLFLKKDADGRYAPVTRLGVFGAETIAQGFSVVRLYNALGLTYEGETHEEGEIHDAAREGDLEKVKALIHNDPALVSSRDGLGYTALHWAAIRGHKEVAEFLLANKADVNAMGYDGQTSLHWAVLNGYADVAELLRQHGGYSWPRPTDQ